MTSRSHVARACGLVMVGALLLLPTSADADEPTCQGQSATIVVSEDGPKKGTEGADVIVIEGADNQWVFDALGGDDLICVTSPTGVGLFYSGDGDDVVDVSAVGASGSVSVDLGRGADQYVGHEGPDSVATDYGDATDNKVDTVSTGGGRDRVHSGTPGLPNPDLIDLGDGLDDLLIEGVPGGEFSAGGGRDSLEVWEAGRRTWAIDAREGADTSVDGEPTGINGFESFDLTLLDWALLSYRGGPGHDRVDTLSNLHDLGEEAPRGRGPIDARLGNGSDRITIDSYYRGRILAGPGHDRLVVKNRCNLRCGKRLVYAELSQDSLHLYGRGQAVRNFSDIELEGFVRSYVSGDASRNTIVVSGCLVDARGLGGLDRVRVSGEPECRQRGHRVDVTAYGGADDDVVAAERWNGDGSATAIGGGGVDQCRAPVKVKCER